MTLLSLLHSSQFTTHFTHFTPVFPPLFKHLFNQRRHLIHLLALARRRLHQSHQLPHNFVALVQRHPQLHAKKKNRENQAPVVTQKKMGTEKIKNEKNLR